MMHSSESKAEFNDDIGCVPSDDAEEENTYYSAVFDVLKQSGIQISKVCIFAFDVNYLKPTSSRVSFPNMTDQSR